MFNAERILEFEGLNKQTETFWWAARNLREGPHEGAYQVLAALLKVGKSQGLRHQAFRLLHELGYLDRSSQADR